MASTAYHGPAVITLPEAERTAFITRVYQHLGLAIAAFVAFEFVLFKVGAAEKLYDLIAGSRGTWLLILGGFMIVNWLATQASHDLLNPARQYGGLFALAAAEAVIFAPFLYMVYYGTSGGGGTIAGAAVITGVGFAGLTAVAMFTRKDLSFIRPVIMWGGVLALVAIVGAVAFGAELGTWFSVAMIGLAGGSILYQTQQIVRNYPATAHVGAAVQLFASVMTLFWYVLRLLSSRR